MTAGRMHANQKTRWPEILQITIPYLILWCLADYFATLFETAPGISAWYPPHAFSLVLLVRYGLGFWPCLIIGPNIMGSLFWMQGEPVALFILSLTITAGYTMQAWILRRAGFDGQFLNFRKTLIFLASGLGCSFLVAFFGLLTMTLFNLSETAVFWRRALDFWAGDTLAVICMSPFLFSLCHLYDTYIGNNRTGNAHTDNNNAHPSDHKKMSLIKKYSPLKHGPPMLIYILITFAAPFNFDTFTIAPFYLLFIPMFAIAIQYSSVGVTFYIFLSNVAVITIIRTMSLDIQINDLQLMITVLSGSGLCFAALIYSERNSAILERRAADMENFSYMLSHDFQSPLRLIVMKGQEIEANSQLDSDNKERLGLILSLGQHMHNLIRSLTDYLVVGQAVEVDNAIELNRVVERSSTHLTNLITERGAHINADQLPSLLGNQQLLVELFQNLIGNAVSYCDKTPDIHIYTKADEQCYTVFIEDNGPGIPETLRHTLFDPFVKYSDEQRGKYKHTGLGLAIAQKIANLHQMTLFLDKSDASGSRFGLTIPRERVLKASDALSAAS